MGRAVHILGQHTLNVMDPKAMLQDVATRFDANTYYCFIAPSDWGVEGLAVSLESKGVKNPCEVPAYIIDEYHVAAGKDDIVLIIDNYYYQWLYDRYGDQAGHREECKKMWTSDAQQNNEIIQGFIHDDPFIDMYYQNSHLLLSRECAEFYIMDRSYFLDLVFHDSSVATGLWQKPAHYQQLLNARAAIRDALHKLGGRYAYYVCENGTYDGGFGQGVPWALSWSDIEATLNEGATGQYQLNLGELLTNKAYFETAKAKYINEQIDYSVFYDDFRNIDYEDILPIESPKTP